MTSMFHSLASIILGLTAWALPLICLAVPRRREIFCCTSLTACVLSLYFQLREVMYRVDIGDLSAVMDTINAVVLCATVLIAVTLALNAAALLRKAK
ncbi:MAG: hypothetical protein IJZ39_00130 [Oscillospiraceae bacterium]|nr:hypothetical protein [Oscillospiraceae bacterium]